MITPERSVEEIVEEFENKYFKYEASDDYHTGGVFCGCIEGDLDGITEGAVATFLNELTQTLKAERQKGEEMVRAERERIVEIARQHIRPLYFEDFKEALTQPNNPK